MSRWPSFVPAAVITGNPSPQALRASLTNLHASLRFVLRSLRLVAHVALGLLLATLLNLAPGHRLDAYDWQGRWARRLLRILGLRFEIRGQPIAGGQMIVCNHISWLDIPLLAASHCHRFVAKSEIQHWPVASWLAQAARTFYIRRGPGGSRPLLDKLTPHLCAGGSIVIFPEGTTTAGNMLLPFHPRLFQAAIEAQCPVQPVALRFGSTPAGENLAAFIGDDDLVSHLVRLLRAPGLTAELIYCAPIYPQDHQNRLALAARAEDAIRQVVAPQTRFKKPALLELLAKAE